MAALLQKIKEEVNPKLAEALGKSNVNALPKIEKVVINACLGSSVKDSQLVETVGKNLTAITGQTPVKTVARKAISNFKVREGMFLGYKVTLRGKRMYDFIDKLINITLPRVRDFKGLTLKSIDGQGNLNIGFKEQVAFAEIGAEGVEQLHGLEVTIVTSAEENKEGAELFKLLGFPFKELKKGNE